HSYGYTQDITDLSTAQNAFQENEKKYRTLFENMVQGAFFYDLGNSWKNRDEIKYKIGKETDEFKSGFGVGIRFTTPMFPIRIDYGYGLNHKAGQDKAHFYFTVGNFL
ncbi:MAG: BamA/TamA family outer membrane protein, partial [Elusimicrobiaceae bacterium]|nr:BamA/TamA family outer membrane protein [Elusimicrobiaceae bacterium]